MKNMTKEMLLLMDGTEIWSDYYEGCVGVRGQSVMSYGKVIDTLDTPEKVERLWREMLDQELGGES